MTKAQTPTSALAQADLLLLVAGAFSRPAHGIDALRQQSDADLHELALRSSLPSSSALSAELISLKATIDATNQEDWAAWKTRLFEGPVLCPINETTYVRRDKGAILADICGFYSAFGFQMSEAGGENPDHLAAELEFTALLLIMWSQARQAERTEAETVTRAALRAFLHDHLNEWLPIFVERLCNTAAHPVATGIAAVLGTFWEGFATDFDLPTPHNALRKDEEDRAESDPSFECGLAGVCPTAPRATDIAQRG